MNLPILESNNFVWWGVDLETKTEHLITQLLFFNKNKHNNGRENKIVSAISEMGLEICKTINHKFEIKCIFILFPTKQSVMIVQRAKGEVPD